MKPQATRLDEHWAAIRQEDQRIVHLVPMDDGILHDFLDRSTDPRLLLEGTGDDGCVCGPHVQTTSNGYRIVLHHALNGQEWPPPPVRSDW